MQHLSAENTLGNWRRFARREVTFDPVEMKELIQAAARCFGLCMCPIQLFSVI